MDISRALSASSAASFKREYGYNLLKGSCMGMKVVASHGSSPRLARSRRSMTIAVGKRLHASSIGGIRNNPRFPQPLAKVRCASSATVSTEEDNDSTSVAAFQPKLKVRFVIPEFVTRPGQDLRVVGSLPELGSWNIDNAPGMTWNEGHRWTLDTSLPKDSFEFKVVCCEHGNTRWEKEGNRVVAVGDSVTGMPIDVMVQVSCWFDMTSETSFAIGLPAEQVESAAEMSKATLELLEARTDRIKKKASGKEGSPVDQELLRLQEAMQSQAKALGNLKQMLDAPREDTDSADTIMLPVDSIDVPKEVSSAVGAVSKAGSQGRVQTPLTLISEQSEAEGADSTEEVETAAEAIAAAEAGAEAAEADAGVEAQVQAEVQTAAAAQEEELETKEGSDALSTGDASVEDLVVVHARLLRKFYERYPASGEGTTDASLEVLRDLLRDATAVLNQAKEARMSTDSLAELVRLTMHGDVRLDRGVPSEALTPDRYPTFENIASAVAAAQASAASASTAAEKAATLASQSSSEEENGSVWDTVEVARAAAEAAQVAATSASKSAAASAAAGELPTDVPTELLLAAAAAAAANEAAQAAATAVSISPTSPRPAKVGPECAEAIEEAVTTIRRAVARAERGIAPPEYLENLVKDIPSNEGSMSESDSEESDASPEALLSQAVSLRNAVRSAMDRKRVSPRAEEMVHTTGDSAVTETAAAAAAPAAAAPAAEPKIAATAASAAAPTAAQAEATQAAGTSATSTSGIAAPVDAAAASSASTSAPESGTELATGASEASGPSGAADTPPEEATAAPPRPPRPQLVIQLRAGVEKLSPVSIIEQPPSTDAPNALPTVTYTFNNAPSRRERDLNRMTQLSEAQSSASSAPKQASSSQIPSSTPAPPSLPSTAPSSNAPATSSPAIPSSSTSATPTMPSSSASSAPAAPSSSGGSPDSQAGNPIPSSATASRSTDTPSLSTLPPSSDATTPQAQATSDASPVAPETSTTGSPPSSDKPSSSSPPVTSTQQTTGAVASTSASSASSATNSPSPPSIVSRASNVSSAPDGAERGPETASSDTTKEGEKEREEGPAKIFKKFWSFLKP